MGPKVYFEARDSWTYIRSTHNICLNRFRLFVHQINKHHYAGNSITGLSLEICYSLCKRTENNA